jgi:hypothetical protein
MQGCSRWGWENKPEQPYGSQVSMEQWNEWEAAVEDWRFGSIDLRQWEIDTFRECRIEDENKPWVEELIIDETNT